MKARGFDTCFCPAWEQKGRSQIFWGDGSGKAASSLAEETEGVWSDCPRVMATPLPDPACLVLPHTSGAGAGLGAAPLWVPCPGSGGRLQSRGWG